MTDQETKETAKTKKASSKTLIDATIILAFFTGFLFAAGMAWYNSFLTYWGLDATNYPISFHETSYMGLVTIFNFSAGWFPQLTLNLSLLALVSVVAITTSPNVELEKWVRGKIKTRISEGKQAWIAKIETMLYWVVGLFFGFILLGVLFYSSEHLGKGKAKGIHESIKTSEIKLFSSMNKKSGDAYGKFSLIACNQFECAVYWQKEQEVELVERKSIKGASLSLPYPLSRTG